MSIHAVIVANGELGAESRLRALWDGADLRIAADGGARNARHAGWSAPQVVIGDQDSLDEDTRRWLADANAERRVYPREKDWTDLELAIDLALERGAERITVLGALGGRTDQELANVLLLARVPGLRLAGREADLWVAGDETEIEGRAGDTVSLLPLSESVEGVETEELRYPLRKETLTRGSTRGVSNEMLAPRARVRHTRGALLVVHLHRNASG